MPRLGAPQPAESRTRHGGENGTFLRPLIARKSVDQPTLYAYPGTQFDLGKGTKGRHMGKELTTGDRAPTFTLPRDGGRTVSLADFKGRNLVIYFYPRADTPGCTRESIDFSRLRSEFGKAGTDILGVSAD